MKANMIPIAFGGTSEIYRTQVQGVARPCTIKILKTDYSAHATLRHRFATEIRLLQALRSPGLPQVLRHGEIKGRPYYAYKYIDGTCLTAMFQRKQRASTEQALDFSERLLSILQTLQDHDAPVIHGDISPENLIIDDQGNVTLLDFGTAQELQGFFIPECRWIGKPSYLSPEQAQARPWDERSDLYQTGLVLYEYLSGKRCMTARGPQQARAMAAAPPAVDLSLIDPLWHAFLRRLLHEDRAQRFYTARECRLALLRLREEYLYLSSARKAG